jgi:FlaA1/EpsC-like NDP-sugar epimerase
MLALEHLISQQSKFSNCDELRERVANRTVLVTGAGGSIGSELCRQVLPCKPRRLVLLGHGEHSIFTLLADLSRRDSAVPLVPVIASVQSEARMQQTFQRFAPDVVFHAAAHKHVPLMEQNIEEAVLNNVLGTCNVVSAATESGAGVLLLISTDKALNPVSVLGATKRVAELIISEAASATGRCFVSVRFGNVIDSRGGVVSVFNEQISRGGPVTVTHPDMERYFMTTHNAVELVLQAVRLGKGGETFVLDVGQPLRIVDVAEDLIRSHGLRPGSDIQIVFTGVRPGERLTEELFRDGHYQRTTLPKVLILGNGHHNGNHKANTLQEDVLRLIEAAQQHDQIEVRKLLATIVPEYNQSAQLNSEERLPQARSSAAS